MAFTHTVTKTVQTPEGQTSMPVAYTGSRVQAVDDLITTGTTDQLVDVAFTRAALKSFYFLSDQAITLETNATDHSGGDTFSIQANVPFEWQAGGYYANPFSADVTKFYLTNASGSTANYSARVLTDGTP